MAPVQIIGKMTLNRNPDNYFAETEQVAFHSCHLAPGNDFSNEPLLQGRLFSYTDSHLSLLGSPNFHEIPINRPIAAVANNQRDGHVRQTIVKGRVSYEPNSLGSGCPMQRLWSEGGFVTYPQPMEGEKIRVRSETFADHFAQAALFWRSQSTWEQEHILAAFRFELGKVDAALSMADTQKESIAGRKIAVLAAEGVDARAIDTVRKTLEAGGTTVKLIAPRIGAIGSAEGRSIKVDLSFATVSSVLFDAVYVPGGASAEALCSNADAVLFVKEAYKHGKAIAASGEGELLIRKAAQSAGTSEGEFQGPGVFIRKTTDAAFSKRFADAVAQHRFPERADINVIAA